MDSITQLAIDDIGEPEMAIGFFGSDIPGGAADMAVADIVIAIITGG